MLTEKDWEKFERDLEKAAKEDEEMSDEDWEKILMSFPEIDTETDDEEKVVAFALKKRKCVNKDK